MTKVGENGVITGYDRFPFGRNEIGEPVAESWNRACFRVVSTIPMAARSENNRERNGDEGNPPRQGLRSGRKKTRERERGGGSRLVWFYDSKPEPRFDPSFLLPPFLPLSLSFSLSRCPGRSKAVATRARITRVRTITRRDFCDRIPSRACTRV